MLLGITIPFEVWKVQHGPFRVYDVSIPQEFRADLGEEFMKVYLDTRD